ACSSVMRPATFHGISSGRWRGIREVWQLRRRRGIRRARAVQRWGGMSLTADRALWESIVDADAEVPPGRTAAELLPSLLDLLGEDDPYLRDEVGYGVLARWVVHDHLLDRDELRYAVDRLVPDLRL